MAMKCSQNFIDFQPFSMKNLSILAEPCLKMDLEAPWGKDFASPHLLFLPLSFLLEKAHSSANAIEMVVFENFVVKEAGEQLINAALCNKALYLVFRFLDTLFFGSIYDVCEWIISVDS